MGMFNFLRKKEQKTTDIYKFTDEDRQNSAELRKLKKEQTMAELNEQHEIRMKELELRKLEQEAKIEELRFELYGDEEEEEEDNVIESSFMKIIEGMSGNFLNGQNKIPTASPPVQQAEISQEIVLSQEQIESIYQQYKPYMKKVKKMSDEEIKGYLKTNYPQISEKSVNDLLVRVRSS